MSNLPFLMFLCGCGSARRARYLRVRITLAVTSLAASTNVRSPPDMGDGSLVFPGQDGAAVAPFLQGDGGGERCSRQRAATHWHPRLCPSYQ